MTDPDIIKECRQTGMTRTPIQISENRVLCEDKTLWELGRYGWVKLPPIPTEEEYDIMLQDRFKQQTEYLERICKTRRM